ncbi:MAG: non-canonical purine NTP pyrophosphatase [Candidatus Micrarchaeota archaeon]|nr:non-canonical purine NTP pyrophosphatase [Candidatus Micrarchaeota archaeon]
MELWFLTSNRGKFVTAQKRLEPHGINLRWLNKEVPESQSNDLREIASFKVRYAYDTVEKPVMCIDAGFVIPSLNGFPGPFTSYVLKTIGVEGILKLLEGKDRDAYFDHALAYYNSDLKEPVVFSHRVEGEIAEKPRGKRSKWWWSDLFSVFIPKAGDGRVIGEYTLQEWEAVRRNSAGETAYDKLVKWFRENGYIR